MSRLSHVLVLCGLILSHFQTSAAVGDEADSRGIEFFEKKIRPVLVKHCYECHSAKSKEIGGDLLLDTREGIREGGESGHAVVPGNLEDSVLINAIQFEDFEMPPEEQLPETVIADFEKWIRMGAPDPRDGKSVPSRNGADLAQAREFWSFQPIRATTPPPVSSSSWPRTHIDRFVLAKLEANDLQPVADADPRVLVRRVYFDLIGLPPTPAQAAAFVADPSPVALAELIDRLLDSPQFGERWGRHWLDVARYGESTGMERNFTFPYAWRYRDYVIRSFNADKPYDRFVIEQVAGDLLPADDEHQRVDQVIATGLLALGPKSLNSQNREQFVMDMVDEQIDVTTQAFMAFTVACARCHDHKFDPIPNEEYYSLAGIFRSTDTFYGTANQNGNRQQGRLLAIGADGVGAAAGGGKSGGGTKADAKRVASQIKKAQQRLPQLRKLAEKSAAGKKKLADLEAQIAKAQKRLKQLNGGYAPAAKRPVGNEDAILAMGVLDSANPSDTELRIRGEADERGKKMPRGFLSVVSHGPVPQIDPAKSGRLEYAQWLASKDNPLTARVAVNRVWMHLFGKGIVSSVNNFGATGAQPTHPELLDYLANRFVEDGWSIKQLIRGYMNSRVYQLSGNQNAKAEAVDPDNDLLWKMNQRRLEAEAIRDTMLLASGQLDLTPRKGSLVQSVGDGDIGRTLRPEQFSAGNNKRSVYLPIVRGVVPEVLQVFDFPDPSMIFGQREVTTVPTQALYMLNSPLVIEQAKHFAERVLEEESSDDTARVDRAYQLALSRSPNENELATALSFLDDAAQAMNGPSADSDAWAVLCQTIFACSEFRYVD